MNLASKEPVSAPSLGLVAYYREPNGRDAQRRMEMDPAEGVLLSGLLGDEVTLELWAADELVGSKRVPLQSGGLIEVSIPLGAEERCLQVVDERGEPVSGVGVEVTCLESSSGWVGAGDTDAEGRFCLPIPDCRSVQVYLRHSALGEQAQEVRLSGDVAADETLVFQPRSKVRVRLIDDERPVTGVTVWLRPEGLARATSIRYPDSEGVLEWQGLGKGLYHVECSASGYWPLKATVEATRTGRAVQDVPLRRLGDLKVTCLSGSGDVFPAEGLELRSKALGESVQSWVRDERIQSMPADGSLLLRGLPHGEYEWTYRTGRGQETSGSLLVKPGEVTEEAILLPFER